MNTNTVVDKNELLKNLAEGAVEVKFTKKDGTIRHMLCTRYPEIIPIEHHPKGVDQLVTEDTDNIRVFDIEANGWRSFNYSALIV
jgi:hypothetical protein